MSRESKFISGLDTGRLPKVATRLECFGWEAQSYNQGVLLLTRETQDPVYPKLVAYEAEYEKKSADLAHLQEPARPIAPKPINLLFAIIGCLLFLLPGIIYIAYTVFQKKQHEEAMKRYAQKYAEYQAKDDALMNEIGHILTESRELFFSPRR